MSHSTAPLTLQQLYYIATREQLPESLIRSGLTRESARRRKIVAWRIGGMTEREIGVKLGITHGSVRSSIILTMRAIRKRVNELPRYHESGRKPYKPRRRISLETAR